jgi:hypothetical protein
MHMCHGIRIIEQPTYILFIEYNGSLRLAGAYSLAGCPFYHFGVISNGYEYDVKASLNGISLLPFDLHHTILNHILSFHQTYTSYRYLTSDIIIDQTNPFNLMYIVTFVVIVRNSDTHTSTYYYYNVGVPITLVKAGRTELSGGTYSSDNMWNVPFSIDFLFNQSHHYGFSDSSILWQLNPNFTSLYFNGYDFYYPPMMDTELPSSIWSDSIIKSDGMFPIFKVNDLYNYVVKPFIPPVYTLMPIVGNYIFLDSPQIRICVDDGICTGREESNPSFELVNGVLYRTINFYSPAQPLHVTSTQCC